MNNIYLILTFLFITVGPSIFDTKASEIPKIFEGDPVIENYIVAGKKITFLKYGEDVLISKNCYRKQKQ